MNKKYICMCILFAVIAICLPWIIYNIYPVQHEIQTESKCWSSFPYTPNEMLIYVITALGALFSFIAIAIALSGRQPTFSIKHVITADEIGLAVWIQILNTSTITCEIHQFDLWGKRERLSVPLLKEQPFVLNPGCTKDIIIPVKELEDNLRCFSTKKVSYAICTSFSCSYYHSLRELRKILDEVKKWNGKKEKR